MAPERGAPTIAVVAAEPSGDLIAGALCRALAAAAPGVRLVGMGGPDMAASGVDLLLDFRGFAVIGFTDWLAQAPALYRRYRQLCRDLERARPDVLVLVDAPGLNLRLARFARERGLRVVYYVPPQVWAWKPGRVRAVRERVALVLAALPFERALWAAAGVPVEYVGHPTLDALASAPDRVEARRRLGVGPDELVVGLLPGSREGEIARMTPLLADAATRISARYPGARFVVPLAPTVEAGAVRARLGGLRADLFEGQAHAVMRAADLLLVTSGTAALEAALLGTPMVVVYRVSALTEAIGSAVARVPWISLVNLILGRAAVPEIYRRRNATGENVAGEALRLLGDARALEAQRAAFRELAAMVGGPGVAGRAARLVLDVARGRLPGERAGDAGDAVAAGAGASR